MKHIDKTARKQYGEEIVSRFLSTFYARKNAFPTDSYSAFGCEIDDTHGSKTFRNRLVEEVLYPEQNGICCYCMRDLSKSNKVTIEHLIPNHAADTNEMNTYRTVPTELDTLVHPEEYKNQYPSNLPPHPHTIAYQNLVLSCDGKLFDSNTKCYCCNIKRKHKFVPPFVLYTDIEQTFLYMKDGTAEWTADPEPPESKKNAIKILGLNISILKMIRRIWFFCNENNLTPDANNSSEIVNRLYGAIASSYLDENTSNMLMYFKKEEYWQLFLQYKAFASISHV